MRYGFLALLLMLSLPVQAQETVEDPFALNDPIQLAYNKGLKNSLLASYSKRGSSYDRSKVTETRPQPTNQPTIDFNSLLELDTRPYLPNYWNTYANQPQHRYTPEYKGLHGLIYKQVERLCSRYYRRFSRDYWQQQAEIDPYYLSRYRRFKMFEADFHNRWWDRTFLESFKVEDGGIENRTYIVGETYEVLEIGPLALKNSGKVSWQGWRLNFSHQRERDIDREFDELGNPLPRNRVNERAFVFGISPPRGNLYTAESWTLSGSMKVNFRLGDLQRNGSTIKGRLSFLAYMGYKPKPWLGIELEATARPMRGEYRATLTVALLRW